MKIRAPHHRQNNRSGAALIEVLVALVLLATAGTALVTLLGQTSHTFRRVREEEGLTRLAAQELDQLVLWDRATVISRTGRSLLGDWALTVSAVNPDLFDVEIARPGTRAVLLRTSIYRPDTTHVGFP